MIKRSHFFLTIILFFAVSCISPPRYIDTLSNTPIPRGKARITVQRSDQFQSHGVPIRLFDISGFQDDEDAIVLCNLGKNASIDADKYAEPILKSKYRVIFKKSDYVRKDAFPVIVGEKFKDLLNESKNYSGRSTNPNLTVSERIPEYATSNVGSGAAGRLNTIDKMQSPDKATKMEAVHGISEVLTSSIFSNLSENEIVIDKDTWEKLCYNCIEGKEITKLNPNEIISLDKEPGMVKLYAIMYDVLPVFDIQPREVIHGFYTAVDLKPDIHYFIQVGVGPATKENTGSLYFKFLNTKKSPE